MAPIVNRSRQGIEQTQLRRWHLSRLGSSIAQQLTVTAAEC